MSVTHDARLELGWFAVEYIRGLDSVLHNANSAVEEAHEVTARASKRGCGKR